MIPLRVRMDGVDAAWLRMDRRTNPMMITGVMVLGGRCPLEALRRVVAERFLVHARFRSVPVDEPLGGVWVEDPYFELDQHVGTVHLPDGAGQADLEALVSDLASAHLDERRPRWRFDLVPEYGPGSALIIRIHHCYADGVSLVRVILGLTTTEPDAPAPAPEPAPEGPADDHGLGPLIGALLEPATRLLSDALAGGTTLLEAGMKRLTHPIDTLGEARHAAGLAGEIGGLLALPDEPDTPLRGELGAVKHVAWGKTLLLEEVRTIGRALGCTINDVLISVVAGTLGRYLRGRGVDTRGLTLRATLPVNLRRPEEPASLGNRFGLVILELPVGIEHPFQRLYAVHDRMESLKHSPQPAATLATLATLGHLPAVVQGVAIDLLSRKASAVISNVPGPRETRFLCGRPITEMYFWVPQSGSIGLGISVLTYDRRVQFGLIADRGLLPAPHEVVDAFAAEFEQLLLLTVLGAAHARGPRQASSARACSTSRRSIASRGRTPAARS